MFGVYEIQETIGQGGMGIVYRAHDTALDRIVALKVLKEDLRANKQVAARFQREAQAIASLSHPGIIHIFAVGSVGRIPFISMEFIEGITVSQLMKREKRIPWKRALHIAEQVAEALASAHESHIIHRDIKPGNVLLGADDRAYVTDFGIAKVLTAETQLTVEGSRLGTPNYMSPERCMNQEITPSSDIYSLGVVLFQMISGRLPYEAPSPVDLIRKIVTDPPARLREYVPDVPTDVERLVAYLIEKKPKDRPGDAGAVARMCRRVIEGEPLFEESAAASSLREFRDSDPSTSTGTTNIGEGGRGRDPIAAIRRVWRDASPAAKLWSGGIGVIVAAGALGQLAVLEANAGFARGTVNQWDRSTSGWARPASPAEFTQESPGVAIVRVNVPLMTGVRITAAGASDFAVDLEGSGSAKTAAIVMISADPAGARMVIPPGPRAGGPAAPLLVGSEAGASPAFPDDEAVLFARSSRRIDSSWMPELLCADGLLGDKGYGWVLIDGDALAAAGGGRARSIYAASISVSSAELVLAADLGVSDGHAVYAAQLAQGALDGNPRLVSDVGGEVERLAHDRAGTVCAARRDAGGGVSIVRYAAAGRGTSVYTTQDTTASVADLTADGAAIVSGAPDERVLTWIELASGVSVPLGAGHHAAIAPRGDAVFVTAPDYRGNAQVYRVGLDAPEFRIQLTFLARGVGGAIAVSYDGRFVLATLAERGTPNFVLITVDEAAAAAP